MYVNVYTEEFCELWLVLIKDGSDFDIDAADDDSIGEMPEWLDCLHEDGWDLVLGKEWKRDADDFCIGWVWWALENGLVPGKPFCIRVSPPFYSSTETDCGTEYDVEWIYEIVAKTPATDKYVAHQYNLWLKSSKTYKKAVIAAWQKMEYEAKHNIKEMYLQSDHYYAHSYDDMAYPDGVCIRLHGKNGYNLASGRDDGGDWNKAYERLWEQVRKELPHLDIEVLKKLSLRRWI